MRARPDVDAALRGGDWDQPMNGEVPIGDATIKQALYWRQIYSDNARDQASAVRNRRT